jgi:hypothetical protein
MLSKSSDQLSLPTAKGEAIASLLAGNTWSLSTPWSKETFDGDKTGAFKRLRALVWEAEALPEHNTAHQAVQRTIQYLTSPVDTREAPQARASDALSTQQGCDVATTLVL